MSTYDSPVADLVEEFDRWATALVSSSSTYGQMDDERHGQDSVGKDEDMQDNETKEFLSPQEGNFSFILYSLSLSFAFSISSSLFLHSCLQCVIRAW